ncbi:MAG: hypothetical protein GY765_30150, partial [bacterium]|nr:hypothetical protein [bacterium]
LWAELLGIEEERIGVNSDFFRLGGHSLKATLLTGRIKELFNVNVPLAKVFSSRTIGELASYIKGSTKDLYFALQPVETKEFYALSPAQKRMFLLQQMNQSGTAYNMPSFWILEGLPDKDKLEKTFKQLIRRHDSFRTSFAMETDEPVQKIEPVGCNEFQIINVPPAAGGKFDETKIVADFVKPFDLSKAPILRVGLMEMGEEKWLLMVDMHH